MNFSGISNQTFIGQLLRLPLRAIPSQFKMPILQGKLKGKQWIVGSSQHGCWLGSYEYEKQLIFQEYIKPGDIVFDLGAHVGFHTLLASVLVGSDGAVYAFEPMPDNLSYLKTHVRINNISNITVIEAAVCDQMGTAYFEGNSCSFQGRLSKQGKFSVKTVGLDALLSDGKVETPNCIKIDVEGAEVNVLKGAKKLLSEKHPTIFLATHGNEIQRKCRKILTELDYNLQSISEKPLDISDEILAKY